MTARHEVCPVSALPPGGRRIVEVAGLSIGVFNVGGEFYALANACPHQLAPLCAGRITGETVAPAVGEFERVRDGEVVQCPWHGWKFDIRTGESVFNPHKLSAPTFDVEVEPAASDRTIQGDRSPDGTGGEGDDRDHGRDYGTALLGEEPPVETYDVAVEEDVVVLYV